MEAFINFKCEAYKNTRRPFFKSIGFKTELTPLNDSSYSPD